MARKREKEMGKCKRNRNTINDEDEEEQKISFKRITRVFFLSMASFANDMVYCTS